MSEFDCPLSCSYYQECMDVVADPNANGEVVERAGSFLAAGVLCLDNPKGVDALKGAPPRHCAVLAAAKIAVDLQRYVGEEPGSDFMAFYHDFFRPGPTERDGRSDK